MLAEQPQPYRATRLGRLPLLGGGPVCGCALPLGFEAPAVQPGQGRPSPTFEGVLATLPDAPTRRPDGVGRCELTVAVEGPCPVEAQVDPQPGDGGVVEGHVGAGAERQEEVLAVGLAAQEDLTVKTARPVGEAPLRRAHAQALTAVELVKGGGEPVDGVPLRHAQAPVGAPVGSAAGAGAS